MDFLTDAQIQNLSIKQLIFHVVQHEGDEPILLDETPIGGFESFFLERVRETLKGNHFQFVQGSDTLRILQEISKNPKSFVSNSKQLAINFHAARDGRIKPGAIILIRLTTTDKELFSLLKYDREQVIAYNLINDTRAVLEEIINSFTNSKSALQKCALIELDNEGGNLVVIDRTVNYDITDFFRGFLNVRRLKPENEMTESVHKAALKTTTKHRNDLPKEITGKIRSITFQAIQDLETFNEDEFFDKVFGSHGNPKIRHTYNTFLKQEGIQGDTFRFIKNAIKPPKERKYRTSEGVKITVGQEAEDTITIEQGRGNEPTIITIKTDKLTEE